MTGRERNRKEREREREGVCVWEGGREKGGSDETLIGSLN